MTKPQWSSTIDADVDAERNKPLDDLNRARQLTEHDRTVGLGLTPTSKNGGGDHSFTDGDIRVSVLVPSENLVAKEDLTRGSVPSS